MAKAYMVAIPIAFTALALLELVSIKSVRLTMKKHKYFATLAWLGAFMFLVLLIGISK